MKIEEERIKINKLQYEAKKKNRNDRLLLEREKLEFEKQKLEEEKLNRAAGREEHKAMSQCLLKMIESSVIHKQRD